MLTPALLVAVALVQPSEPAAAVSPPASAAAVPAVAERAPLPPDEPTGDFSSAGELLARLETAGADLRTFTADIQYSKTFAAIQGGDQQVRRGKLYYEVRPGGAAKDAAPIKVFSVIFDTLIVDGAVRPTQRHFIFNGTHLIERDLTEKQFLKRRVVKPGDRIDPLRLGEGPFPLPIGQKKAEILARFDARLLSDRTGWDGPMPKPLEGTVQLYLVPKPGTPEARDFDEVRIWYRTSDLLPRFARTSTPAGAQSEVLLINLAANTKLDAKVFDAEPPAEPGWQVDIREEFRGMDERIEAPRKK